MRKSVFPLVVLAALLAGCVTINVYFPAAAAQQAAEKFIDNVIGPDTSAPPSSAPPASSAPDASANDGAQGQPLALRLLDAVIPTAAATEPTPNLKIHTPAIDAVQARMRARFHATLKALLDSGAVGYTHDGGVAIRDASKIPLPQRAAATRAVADENADRTESYRLIAEANGHPEWATSMREAFAKKWIALAHAGWYYQDASGNWKRK